jgi:CRISPR-associated endonuclease Cas2
MRLRLICYDISEDKLRNKVSDLLLKHSGYRLQKSVFAAMQKEEDFQDMRVKIGSIMGQSEDKTDSIYFIIVSQEMFSRMQIEGMKPDIDFILGKLLCLWIE